MEELHVPSNVSTVAEHLRQSLSNVIERKPSSAITEIDSKIDWNSLGFLTINQARQEALEEITDGISGQRLTFPTGFVRLDRQLLGGFTPGKLYVIAGRPGTGKSLLANELLFRAVSGAVATKKKVIALYWTFEMAAKEQLLRLVSKDLQITQSEMLSVESKLDSVVMNKIVQSSDKFKDLPVYFRQISSTIVDAFSYVQQIHRSLPDHTIINVWDHSRLFISSSNTESELTKLVELTQGLIRMQQQTKCINILLSQLNRNIEQPTRATTQYQPMLSDLFGSDSVGQEAHVVMMINRPNDIYGVTAKYCGEDPINLFAIHFEKNRGGPLGMIPFNCVSSTFSLHERK